MSYKTQYCGFYKNDRNGVIFLKNKLRKVLNVKIN